MNQRNDITPDEPQTEPSQEVPEADETAAEPLAAESDEANEPSAEEPESAGESLDDVSTDEPGEDSADVSADETDKDPGDEQDDAAPAAPEADLAKIATSIEALLFASDSPLPPAKIAAAAEAPPRLIKKAIALLNERYEQMHTAFRVEAIAGGYQMLTRPEYHDVLTRMLAAKKDSRLSQAALETLAIVAYRQPILRADVEVIRGVACGEVLRSLMDRNLVKIVGRAEVIGRPMLYGTTKYFLQIFGLGSLDDLPRIDELRGKSEPPAPAKSPPAEDSDADHPAEPAGTPDDEQAAAANPPVDEEDIRDEDLDIDDEDEDGDEDEDDDDFDDDEEFDEDEDDDEEEEEDEED